MDIKSFEKLMHPSWWVKLKPFLETKEFEYIWNKIKKLGVDNKIVYPYSKLLKKQYPDIENTIFNPFLMDFNKVEIIIFTELNSVFTQKHSLGQLLDDNYYNAIEKSIYGGLNLNMIKDYNFEYLKEQGVMILPNSLTSEVNLPHYPIWESFITEVFRLLLEYNRGLHIILLGKNTHKYSKLIDNNHYFYKSDINYNNYDMFSIIKERVQKNNNKKINWVLENEPY